MDRQENATPTDFDLLNRLKPFSSLSAEALRELASGLNSANFQKREVILREEALATGGRYPPEGRGEDHLPEPGERVTVALLAPGPIPGFLSLPVSQWHFRCEAHSYCRVGSPGRDLFNAIVRKVEIPTLFEKHGVRIQEWDKVHTDWLTIRSSAA